MKYEVVQDKDDSQDWRAEAIGQEGEVYVTLFSGPQAKYRAREYAKWKNNEDSEAPSPDRNKLSVA